MIPSGLRARFPSNPAEWTVGAIVAVQAAFRSWRHYQPALRDPETGGDILLLILVATSVTLGVTLLIAGMTDLLRRLMTVPSSTSPDDSCSWMLVALALGAVARWSFIDTVPPGVWIDTVYETLPSLSGSFHGPWWGGVPLVVASPIDLDCSTLVSHLYLTYSNLIYFVFGRGVLGITAISAVPSTLALLALAFLVKEFGGWRQVGTSVAILSLTLWPVIAGRWTWTGSALLPMVLLSAAFTIRSLRTGLWWDGFLAGLALGLGLHLHPASGGAVVGLGLFAISTLRTRGGPRLVGWAVLGLAVGVAPLIPAYVDFPETLGGRLRDVPLVSVTAESASSTSVRRSAADFLINVVDYTGLLVGAADPNPRHGLPRRGLVPPLVAVACLLGLGVGIGRRRAADRMVLLLGLGALLPGILAAPSGVPNSTRACLLLIPLAIWSGDGFLGLIHLFRDRVRPSLAFSGVLVLLLTFEVLPVRTTWAESGFVFDHFLGDQAAAGGLLKKLAPLPVRFEDVDGALVVEVLSGAEPSERLDGRGEPSLQAPDNRRWFVLGPGVHEEPDWTGWQLGRSVRTRPSRSALRVVYGRFVESESTKP